MPSTNLINPYNSRSNRIPSISVPTGAIGFNPIPFQAAVFTPEKQDMSLLQKSMATLDERKENTDKQRAALKAAIGKIELNAAEDEWKTNYINDISAKIDNAAQFGDYATALEIATNLAGEAISNPALLGRERANKKYQEELKRITENKTLDELTKQRWAAVNPYSYSDIKDSKGNIVAGTDWNATFNPVADVDIAQLRTLAAQMTAEESGSSGGNNTRQVLVDKNGNETKDFNEATTIKMTTSTGGNIQYAKKDKAKMARVWNSLKSDSKILQGLNQKYETLRWAYKTAKERMDDSSISDEEREIASRELESYKSQISDKDGVIYSNAETWAQATIIPGFADMEYNNRYTRSDSSTLYNEAYFAQQEAINNNNANNADAVVSEDTGTTGTKIRIDNYWNTENYNSSQFNWLLTNENKER